MRQRERKMEGLTDARERGVDRCERERLTGERERLTGEREIFTDWPDRAVRILCVVYVALGYFQTVYVMCFRLYFSASSSS